MLYLIGWKQNVGSIWYSIRALDLSALGIICNSGQSDLRTEWWLILDTYVFMHYYLGRVIRLISRKAITLSPKRLNLVFASQLHVIYSVIWSLFVILWLIGKNRRVQKTKRLPQDEFSQKYNNHNRLTVSFRVNWYLYIVKLSSFLSNNTTSQTLW